MQMQFNPILGRGPCPNEKRHGIGVGREGAR